jgi:hypothetical protein
MNDYFKLILGSTPLATFLAAYTFAVIGIIMSLQFQANSRDIPSPSTPVKFSAKFLVFDNLIRLVSGAFMVLLTLFIMLRFSVEIMGTALSMITSFGLGFGYDKALQVLKNKEQLISTKFTNSPEPAVEPVSPPTPPTV